MRSSPTEFVVQEQTTKARSRALVIIYTFPPMGGAGVQRAVKFAKYLPHFGWHPTFLTVKDVMYHVYDHTLLREVPAEVDVVRTESADPLRVAHRLASVRQRDTRATSSQGMAATPRKPSRLIKTAKRIYGLLQSWFFIVDPQILWLPFAAWTGIREARRRKVDVIVAMPQPSSTALTGFIISRVTGLPLVLDLRDPWTQCPYFKMPTRIHRWVNNALERRVFAHARQMVVISRSMRDAIVKKYPELASKVNVITNGFDSNDFKQATRVEPKTSFEITYTGSLYAHHVPVFHSFCLGVAKLIERRPELRAQLTVRIVGRVDAENLDVIEQAGLSDICVITGYVPHTVALSYTQSADALLLLIKNDLDPAKHVVTIPGKVFEYLASYRPIIFIGPASEASDILESTRQGRPVPEDPDQIASEVEQLFDSRTTPTVDTEAVHTYERREIARRFAAILDSTTEGRLARSPKDRAKEAVIIPAN